MSSDINGYRKRIMLIPICTYYRNKLISKNISGMIQYLCYTKGNRHPREGRARRDQETAGERGRAGEEVEAKRRVEEEEG
jgi:hypothetical protein